MAPSTRTAMHLTEDVSPAAAAVLSWQPGNGATAAWIWLDPAARGRRPPHNNTVHVACHRALAKTMDTLACPRSKEQQPTQVTKTPTCPTEVVCPSAREELSWPPSPLNDRCLRSSHGCHGSHMPLSVCPSLLFPPPGLEPGSLG